MADFQKVAECLYRYAPTGVYYARLWVKGKEVRHSLRTTDKALAKRRLVDKRAELSKVRRDAGECSLAQLCDRYMETVRSQAPKTIYRKEAIARRIKTDWPDGAGVSIAKIRQSHVAAWLSSYKFGVPSYNLHLLFVRAAFALAVADRLLAESPVDGLKIKKAKKPIRTTPNLEEFQAIVADIRAMIHNPDNTDSGDFVEFIGYAGLGQAEAGALTWGDVDFRKGQITTFRQKTSRGFAVPIYPQLLPLLERMRAERGGHPGASEHVFRVKDAKKAITAACKRLEFRPYSHRSFRRMFITLALERGVDVKVIAQWQGHRDGGKLILDTYSHLRTEHGARMAELMA